MSTPPVPTQRKVKLVGALKTVLSEQSAKLQIKNQLENDLLEDIRSYSKLRAAVEKEYAQGLLKITSQMLAKFQLKDQKKEESRTPYGLWRQILEDTESMANTRMTMSQNFQTNVADSIKTLKAERTGTVKKCSALVEKLHEELQVSAAELAKSQKSYGDLQKVTKQATDSTSDAQEKLKKGTTGLFSSKAKMEKNLSKATERKDVAEKRSTIARNDYLLSLAAMNGHQQKYYSLDLPDVIAVQDGNIYEDFRKYYTVITSADRESCQKCVKSLLLLEENISQLERAFAIQCFLKENPVFTKCVPYEFTPLFNDKVSTISENAGAGLPLNKEARKLSLRLAREQKSITKKTKELNGLQALKNNDTKVTTEVPSDGTKTTEQTIDDLIEEIRHLEVMRTKTEARVETLRSAGVDVDSWLQDALAEKENEESGKRKSDGIEDIDDNDDDEDFGEDEWDEPSLSPQMSFSYSDDTLSINSSLDPRLQTATAAVAIYSFQASSSEELTITDGEELEFLEREGDGWCKTRNKVGQVGFVPEAYIEIRDRRNTNVSDDKTSRASSLTGSININDTYQEIPVSTSATLGTKVTEITESEKPEIICFAKAMYDYDACEEEELSFQEGDVIMVVSKMVDDDDGWWEGLLNGKRGVFPSIVVEETKAPDNAQDYPVFRLRTHTAEPFATLPRGFARNQNEKRHSLDLDSLQYQT